MMSMTPVAVSVQTSNNRGHTPEEVAERCLSKIISVSDTAPEVVKRQAQEYRSDLRKVLIHYMKEAVNSDRTTMYNMLTDNGHADVAEIIRRL